MHDKKFDPNIVYDALKGTLVGKDDYKVEDLDKFLDAVASRQPTWTTANGRFGMKLKQLPRTNDAAAFKSLRIFGKESFEEALHRMREDIRLDNKLTFKLHFTPKPGAPEEEEDEESQAAGSDSDDTPASESPSEHSDENGEEGENGRSGDGGKDERKGGKDGKPGALPAPLPSGRTPRGGGKNARRDENNDSKSDEIMEPGQSKGEDGYGNEETTEDQDADDAIVVTVSICADAIPQATQILTTCSLLIPWWFPAIAMVSEVADESVVPCV